MSEAPPGGTATTAGPLVDTEASRARSSLAVSLGLLGNAAVGFAQAVALIAIVGVGDDTDAFLAAYSLYLPVVLLGNTLRSQLIPLFGPSEPEGEFRRRATELSGRATLIGALASVALVAVAPLAARLVAHGLPEDAQRLAVVSLLILAPVAFLHYRGVTLSALLAAARRFTVSSGIYVAAAIVGLGCSVALMFAVGAAGAALGLLVGAAVLALAHEIYVRRFGVRVGVRLGWLRERRQWELLAWITGYAAMALAQQLNLAIALSGVSGDPGQITVYVLAYTGVLVLLNLTSVSLGLVLLPDLVSELATRGRAAAREYLVRVTGFSFALLAPVLVALVADGRALMLFALDSLLSRAEIELMFDLVKIFAVATVPIALAQSGIGIAVALRRWRLMYCVAAVAVVLQLIGVAIVASDGPLAVAGVHAAVATVASLALLAGVFGRALGQTLSAAAVPIAKAFGLASVVLLVRLPLGGDPSAGEALAALVVGVALYAVALRWLWPEVGRPLTARFLPSPG